MSKTAIYPGTFDPITFGHIDVIKKSLKIVDRLIVATTDNIEKDYLFSLDERIEILNKCLFNDLRFNKNKIKIISFDDLTVKICKKYVFVNKEKKYCPGVWEKRYSTSTIKNGDRKNMVKTDIHEIRNSLDIEV